MHELAEGRLEHLDELNLSLGTVVRRAVFEAIGLALASGADPPKPYEPRSDRYRQAFGLDEAPPDAEAPTEDVLAARRVARAKHHAGLNSLAGFMKKTPG